jgi:hypothetical protein
MEILGLNQFSLPEMLHPLVYIGLLLLSYAAGVEDIPVLDKDKRIIADLTLADLLKFVVNSNEH